MATGWKMVMGLLIFLSFEASGQTVNKLLREGNKLYEKGKFGEAEMNYRKGLELEKENPKGQFNLGDAIYQQKKYDESARIFESLTASKQLDKNAKAEIYHNLGNALLESKQYEKSIGAYKNSLINNPSDKETKYNLEYAKMMLRKQQQQQQQQNQQKKDQDKKDQKQDQQKQDQQQDQQKQQQQDPKKISKEDAERMLEALKNDEKKTMQKVKKEKAQAKQPVPSEKDW